jgi:hypothetical protein
MFKNIVQRLIEKLVGDALDSKVVGSAVAIVWAFTSAALWRFLGGQYPGWLVAVLGGYSVATTVGRQLELQQTGGECTHSELCTRHRAQ